MRNLQLLLEQTFWWMQFQFPLLHHKDHIPIRIIQTQLSMIKSVTKQVIHLLTKRWIISLRDEGINWLVDGYWTYFRRLRTKYYTKWEMFIKCIECNQCRKVNTITHCHMKNYLTKCVLSHFNRGNIPYITVLCRWTITCLFALSTNTVHWNLTPLCFWVRMKTLTGLGYSMTGSFPKRSNWTFNDDSSTKQDICLTTRTAVINLRDQGIELLLHSYWTFFKMEGIKFNIKLEMYIKWSWIKSV